MAIKWIEIVYYTKLNRHFFFFFAILRLVHSMTLMDLLHSPLSLSLLLLVLCNYFLPYIFYDLFLKRCSWCTLSAFFVYLSFYYCCYPAFIVSYYYVFNPFFPPFSDCFPFTFLFVHLLMYFFNFNLFSIQRIFSVLLQYHVTKALLCLSAVHEKIPI